jgi:hypothetical protein
MAQSHSESRLEAAEELPERERPWTIEPYQNIKTSCHFHHIDIDSIMLDTTCRVEKRHPRSRDHSGRIEGKIRMFAWGKSSGADIAQQNFAFFAPPPSERTWDPSGWRGTPALSTHVNRKPVVRGSFRGSIVCFYNTVGDDDIISRRLLEIVKRVWPVGGGDTRQRCPLSFPSNGDGMGTPCFRGGVHIPNRRTKGRTKL